MNESKNVSKSQAKHDSKEDCEIWVLKAQASDEGEPGEEASIQKAVYDVGSFTVVDYRSFYYLYVLGVEKELFMSSMDQCRRMLADC